MIWISRTKLLCPEPVPDIFDRSEMLEHVRNEITTKRFTLISAQAGSGKTTLVASLSDHYPDLPITWISLDEGDNRLDSFMALFTAAAGRILPGCTLNSAVMMANQPEMSLDPHRLMGLFINDILDCNPEPFVLVLDDIHAIDDRDSLAALDYLLAHMPSMMHLVATSRSDPPLSLSKLRVRGQLGEIRMAQLRFSMEEIAAWLNSDLGLKLSEKELALVEQQTEGWVTALRLLVLSLQARGETDREQVIKKLNQGHQFVFDYLVDEVVSRLPSKSHRFLIETSILSAMTPELCRVVSGRDDAGEQLESLYRQNLFIYRTEESAGEGLAAVSTYRCHVLLRQALQLELRLREPDHLKDLHRRAAAALGTSLEAAEHYRMAGAWDEAADLLEIIVRNQVELGTMPTQLVAHIDRLPEEVKSERFWLRAALGISLLQRGYKEKGRPLLEDAAQQAADAGDELSQAYLLFGLSNVSVGPEMAAYLDQIGSIFSSRGEDVPSRWQVNYHQAMIWKHLHVNEWPAVDHHLESAVDVAIRSGEPGAYYTLATNNFTHFFYSERAAAAVLRLKDALTARFPPDDLLARYGVINISMCQHWYHGEPGRAEDMAQQAQGLSRQYGVTSWADVNSMLILLYSLWMRDDLKGAALALNGMLEHMSKVEAWNVARNDMLCWLAFVRWREGHGAEVRQFLPDMEAHTVFERQRMNTSLARALVAAAEGDLVEADGHLRDAVALERAAGFTATVGAQLLLAVIYWQAGEREAAKRELDIGLAEWQRRDMPGVVLQTGRAIIPLLKAAVAQDIRAAFAGRCLDAFGLDVRPRLLFVETTGESLTPREAEVLGLIVQGKTNPQIAETLIISETTVKSHVTKVLAKLGVSRRTGAAVLARKLGLG